MKKKFYFLPFVAALALTGCSNDDAPAPGNEPGSGEDHYLAISIVSTSTGESSRAEGDETSDENKSSTNPNYEDGSTTENAVTKVRFYFFNSADDATPVKRGSTLNYYDWTDPKGSGTDAPNVERTLNAVLLINTTEGDRLPAKIVAIVNPDESNLGEESLNLGLLREKVNNYAALANQADPSFVMSNSVYINASKENVEATIIKEEHYQSTPELASTNPVKIYVERCVAKVRVKTTIPFDANGMIELKDKNDEAITVDGKNVYAKFLGWNLSGTLPKGYLNKHIKNEWYSQSLLSIPWNDNKYFRSYWADNCAASGDNEYFSFNYSKDKFKFTGTNQTYCNENANRISPTGKLKRATQIIIPATLCDADGNALTICEYAGIRFISDPEKLTELKKAYLFQLESRRNGAYFKKVKGADGKYTYAEISEDDITFKTAIQSGVITEGSFDAGSYYVYACLTTDALNAEWHSIQDDNDNKNIVPAATINSELQNLSAAKIWKNGCTYYFADIMHFSTAGVVRNHIYDINLSKVIGLGTPVYDPDERIYPEQPSKDDTYIAAQINILSWRVVTNDVVLDGTEKKNN